MLGHMKICMFMFVCIVCGWPVLVCILFVCNFENIHSNSKNLDTPLSVKAMNIMHMLHSGIGFPRDILILHAHACPLPQFSINFSILSLDTGVYPL